MPQPTAARLARTLPKDVVAKMRDVVSFEDVVFAEEEIPEDEVTILEPYLADNAFAATWLARRTAIATVVHRALFSATGYFGNEAGDAYIYTLAAIEVTKHRRN